MRVPGVSSASASATASAAAAAASFAPTLEPLPESVESLGSPHFQSPASSFDPPNPNGPCGRRTDGAMFETIPERCEHLNPSLDQLPQPTSQSTLWACACGLLLSNCHKLWSVLCLCRRQHEQSLRGESLNMMKCALLSEARTAVSSLGSVVEAGLTSQFCAGGALWQLHANHLRAKTSQRFTDDVLFSVATRLTTERLADFDRLKPTQAHAGLTASDLASKTASPISLPATPKIAYSAKVDPTSTFTSSMGRTAEGDWKAQPFAATPAQYDKASANAASVLRSASSTANSSVPRRSRTPYGASQDRVSNASADKPLQGEDFRPPPSRAEPLELMHSAVAEFGGAHAHVLAEVGIHDPIINPTLFVYIFCSSHSRTT